MVANVTCPTCGHKCRLPQNGSGQHIRCSSCLNDFAPEAQPAASLLARSVPAQPTAPVPALPPNRTLLAEPEPLVRYTCPRCNKSLESPVSFAGQKLNCPDCDQRLQVPKPSAPSPPPVNKTILAEEQSPAPTVRPQTTPPAQMVPAVPTLAVELVEETAEKATPAPPAPRESCLECGKDVTSRSRVQTCPDCGSAFCSAMCYREHRHHAHPPQSKGRTRYVECPHCGSTDRPYSSTVISSAGWVTFVLLLIFFFPLFWIGLLMTETQLRCSDCGARLR